MRAALLLGGALVLSACSPTAPATEAETPAAVAFDCATGFDALSAAIAAAPGLKAAPKEPGEPYRFYSATDGSVSYMITEPGAPGHPAVLRQAAKGGAIVNDGCPYGDRAGYEQLLAYLEGLAKARGR